MLDVPLYASRMEKRRFLLKSDYPLKRGCLKFAFETAPCAFSAAAAEDNDESDEDYPDIVVVEKVAKAVVHSEPPYVFIERFPLSIIYYDG